MMKFDYKKYLDIKKLAPLMKVVVKYQVLVGSLIVVGIFYFLVTRINSLAGVDKNQARYDQGILELKRITFDQEAIDAIRDLQNRNVNVELDLPSDRDNPF